MTSASEPIPGDVADPPAVEWIRKRDGEVARFDEQTLADSLRRAADDLARELPSAAWAELARMTAFFLSTHKASHVIGSDDVADWVDKALRQTGHEALAESYAAYRNRKLWARSSLVVNDDSAPESAEPSSGTHWDKSRVVQTLRSRLNLDAKRSRQIASQVERRLLGGRFNRLTKNLIREIVNNELAALGIAQRLEATHEVCISTAELKRDLARPGGHLLATHRVAGKVWHDFALREILSQDVAEAEGRGLISIRGLESPTTLAATVVDCGVLLRQSHDSSESIARLGAQLARAVQSSWALVAIDRVEPWLALVAESSDSPAQLAEQFWQEFYSRLSHNPAQCVLNLYGGFPEGTGLDRGAGPLFGQQPSAAEQEFAEALSHELLGRFGRDRLDWPNLRVDWHWHPQRHSRRAALNQRILRMLAEGVPLAIAFDRTTVPLAEGLRRRDQLPCRPVLDYIELNLPQIWRDQGSARSWTAMEDGLARATQLAVRAAVQKREFMRRLTSPPEVSGVDQAVLAVAPMGLDWTVRQLAGASFAEDEGALRLTETLVRYLLETTEREARFFALGVIIDSRMGRGWPTSVAELRSQSGDLESLSGLVPWTDASGLHRQIHATAQLHAMVQAGTLVAWREASSGMTSEAWEETLDWASQSTALVRLRLVGERHKASQAAVEWPEP